MTIADLKQLRALKKEIELLSQEINTTDPEYIADTAKDYSSGYPHNIVIRGYTNHNIVKLRRKLQRKQIALQQEVNNLEEWLDNVSDSEIRQILRMRYKNGLSWNDIARELNFADESVPRKRHNRFFKMTDKSEK